MTVDSRILFGAVIISTAVADMTMRLAVSKKCVLTGSDSGCPAAFIAATAATVLPGLLVTRTIVVADG